MSAARAVPWSAQDASDAFSSLYDARAVLSMLQTAMTDETLKNLEDERLQGGLQIALEQVERVLDMYAELSGAPTSGWQAVFRAAGLIAIMEKAIWQCVLAQSPAMLEIDQIRSSARLASAQLDEALGVIRGCAGEHAAPTGGLA